MVASIQWIEHRETRTTEPGPVKRKDTPPRLKTELKKATYGRMETESDSGTEQTCHCLSGRQGNETIEGNVLHTCMFRSWCHHNTGSQQCQEHTQPRVTVCR